MVCLVVSYDTTTFLLKIITKIWYLTALLEYTYDILNKFSKFGTYQPFFFYKHNNSKTRKNTMKSHSHFK